MMRALAIAAATAALCACSPSGVLPNVGGNEYVGMWERPDVHNNKAYIAKIHITRNGPAFLMNTRIEGTLYGMYPITYADGLMKTNTVLGDMMLTDGGKTLVFAGDQYQKAN